MGILSDFLSSATNVAEGVSSGAMQELYRGALVDSNNKNELFKQFATSVNNRVIKQTNALNEKKSNFNSLKSDFMNNPEKWGYGGKEQTELETIYAPLAKFLEGDTFLGDYKTVKVKVAQALKAEEIKAGEDATMYTPAANFFETRMSDINNQLKAVSNMGWNTWDSQIDMASYKPTELKATVAAEHGFRLTAANYPHLFAEPLKPGQEGLVDAIRLTLLSYNANIDSKGDEVVRQKIFSERYKVIQDSKNPINLGNLRVALGLSSDGDIERFIQAASPYLPMINNLAAQNAKGDPASPEFRANAAQIQELAKKHMNFVKNFIEDEKIDTAAPASTNEAEILRAAAMNSINNFDATGKKKYKINEDLQAMKKQRSAKGYVGVYMKADAGGQIPGRTEEAFRFITVPSESDTENARWVAVSDKGAMFYIPKLTEQVAIGTDEVSVGETELVYKGYARKGDFANIKDLQSHFYNVVKAAQNGEIQIEFINKEVVTAMEKRHIFGTDINTGRPIKYFGQVIK